MSRLRKALRLVLTGLILTPPAGVAMAQCHCGFLDDPGNPWQAWGDARRPAREPAQDRGTGAAGTAAKGAAPRRPPGPAQDQAAATPTGQATPVPPRPQ